MENSGGIQASLAGRYAMALFDLARERKAIDAVSASLATLKSGLTKSDDLRRLTTSARVDVLPQYTPDGRFILYTHEGQNLRGRILRMDAATGAHKTKVTRKGPSPR